MKIHQIKWIDAECDSGWQSLDSIDRALEVAKVPIVSIGYIVRKNNQFIVLSSGLRDAKLPKRSEDRDIFDYTFIPIKWIISNKVIADI